MHILRSNLYDFLQKKAGSQIFHVEFEYTDNSQNRKLNRVGRIRTMNCRLGVGKYTKGIETDRAEKDMNLNILTVYDMDKAQTNEFSKDGAYRRIPLSLVKCIKLHGITYEVK